ncbi:MAG: head GIN domain-containing protein [Bacteroidota bacterium]
MKNVVLMAVLAAVCLSSSAQNDKVIRDDHAQRREVKGFHAIRISGGIDLYLSQGDEAVAVSAADIDVRDRIKTEVENGVLKVYMDTDGWHWGSHGDKKLKAYISFKQLDALGASGGSDVFIENGIRTERLDLNLSGGSDLKGKMTIGELSIIQSGGSDVYLGGEATKLSIHATGGSDFHGYDLVSGECRVDASGGSDVYYKGQALIKERHASGSSDITKKG